MRRVVGICVVGLCLLGTSAFAASPGLIDTPDTAIQDPSRAPSAASDNASPAPAMARPWNGNPLWGTPLKQLSETRDRPIFSPSRRPPPPPVTRPVVAVVNTPAVKPKEPDRPRLSLLGTIVNGDDGFAIVADQASAAAPLRIRIGADYQGWKLRSIRPGSATLQKDDDSMQLLLPRPASEPTPAPGELYAGAGAATPASPPRVTVGLAQAQGPYPLPQTTSFRTPGRPLGYPVRRQ
jgi:general secretion pathway protein N